MARRFSASPADCNPNPPRFGREVQNIHGLSACALLPSPFGRGAGGEGIGQTASAPSPPTPLPGGEGRKIHTLSAWERAGRSRASEGAKSVELRVPADPGKQRVFAIVLGDDLLPDVVRFGMKHVLRGSRADKPVAALELALELVGGPAG